MQFKRVVNDKRANVTLMHQGIQTDRNLVEMMACELRVRTSKKTKGSSVPVSTNTTRNVVI